jgi:phytanoyl-CoA hydroxylase
MSATTLVEQKAFFEREGYLILPGFFPSDSVDHFQGVIEHVKKLRPFDAVLDDLENGERTVLGLMTPEQVARHRIKLYDLHLRVFPIRALALAEPIVPLLAALLSHLPAICHSLYLGKGSAQPLHVDALYMTPSTPLHLIAAWVAMEDTHPDAGPLEYVPCSHLLPQHRFSDGSFHAIESEMEGWSEAMHGAVARAGLKTSRFLAKKGDVFIWHAHLLHGGGPILDASRSRKSYVFHYFSEEDARAGGSTLVPLSGAFWIDRPPQALPAATLVRLPFDEVAYLARYQDVATAVANGSFPDGRAHYEVFGRNEGRLPF